MVTWTSLDPIEIAPLTSIAGMVEVVELQQKIWGYGLPGNDPPYPVRALFSLAKSGGLVAGCRVGDRLAGFALAWIGKREGSPSYYLHSQLVGVLPAFRKLGIGYRLKLFQREFALRNDLDLIRWTFDPLRAANASLNLRKLGAVCCEFQRDLYGSLQSELDGGVDSDRLWADWWIRSNRVKSRLAGGDAQSPVPEIPQVNPGPPQRSQGGVEEPGPALDRTDRLLLVQIPNNLKSLLREDTARALQWRCEVRAVLECYLSQGYIVDECYSGTGVDPHTFFLRMNRDGLAAVLAGSN